MFSYLRFLLLTLKYKIYQGSFNAVVIIIVFLYILLNCTNEEDTLYRAITKSRGFILGKSDCVYCDRAIGLMKRSNVEFTYMPAENNPKLRELIIKRYKQKTVPVVFMDNEFIGGYSDLVMFFEK